MSFPIKTIFASPNPPINNPHQMPNIRIVRPGSQFISFTSTSRRTLAEKAIIKWNRYSVVGHAEGASPGMKDAAVSASSEDLEVTVNKNEAGEMEVRINVSGERTQVIFDQVFSKMVEAAQPIPGFRRVKGGKTPDIPKDILLHILGPQKVKGNVIKKIISSVVAEYVKKENLKVTKDLKVEQSYEDLEVAFEPGKEFSFNAVIRLVQ